MKKMLMIVVAAALAALVSGCRCASNCDNCTPGNACACGCRMIECDCNTGCKCVQKKACCKDCTPGQACAGDCRQGACGCRK